MAPGAVLALAALVGVAAASRSMWSPCGLSMLSSITPLAERGRGRRFAWTASWFVAGATVGGATLGLGAAALAAAVGALAPSETVVAAIVVAAAAGAAAIDAGMLPPALPHRRRQVDERWLNRYRGWVCGAGYGWQIGCGFATYLMTAAVYLVVVLAALGADPVGALVVGTVFGALRGLGILAVAGVRSPAGLAEVHRWFETAREPVRRGVIAVQVAVTVAAATMGFGLALGAAVGAGALVVAAAGPARSVAEVARAARRPLPGTR